MPKHTAPLYAALIVREPLPLDNGEAPVSFSLTLSGGFNVTFSTGLHSPGSLSNDANAYYSRSLRFFCQFSNASIAYGVKLKRGFGCASLYCVQSSPGRPQGSSPITTLPHPYNDKGGEGKFRSL